MTALPVIDGHTHICGTGENGSGCVISRKLLSSLAFRFLRWKMGLGILGKPEGLDGKLRAKLFSDLDQAPSVDYVILYGHDRAYGADGKPLDLPSMYTPNEYVLQLAREHPKILPGVSIHPDRPGALDALARCAEAGAVLVKWLPPNQGMDPAAKRHRPFYEALARLGLPLVVHTGGEHTVPVFWPEYCDPAALELALDCGVKVIAAHSGTRSGLINEPDFYGAFAQLARRYPNCYGDTAAFATPVRIRHLARFLADPEVLAKTVHGSDYPVPVMAWAGLGRIPFREIRRMAAIPSPLERDVAIKRAAGMPDAHFRTLAGLLPASAWERKGKGGTG